MSEYQILQVSVEEGVVVAILPCFKVADRRFHELLAADIDQLAAVQGAPMTLDLCAVRFFDGTFPGQLVRLGVSASKSGSVLTVKAGAEIAGVFRTLLLDRLFRLVEADGKQGTSTEHTPAGGPTESPRL